MKIRSSKLRSKRLNGGKVIGGKVIGSGGFGCIVRPALKCKGQPRTTQKMVSKIMEKSVARKEYNEIIKFKKVLTTIPNYTKYFLLDNITLCSPDRLTPDDLKNFNQKCNALTKRNFSAETVNINLNNLMVLTIPDGGMDLGDYMDTIRYFEYPKVNNIIIDLLLNGIIKMNEKRVLHSDIKNSNILMDGRHATLIDWGLSTTYTPDKIPDTLKNRPIYINAPFSIILFNNFFMEMYLHFLKTTPEITPQVMSAFVHTYVTEYFDYAGVGHYNAIKRIIGCLFVDPLVSPKPDIAMDFIVDYLTLIITTYTIDGRINLLQYFLEVFVHIVDVWGFITIYFDLFMQLANNYSMLSSEELKLYDAIKAILLTHMFEPRVKRNDIKKLVSDLRELDDLFLNCQGTSITSTNYTSLQVSTNTSNPKKSLSRVQSKKLVKRIISQNLKQLTRKR